MPGEELPDPPLPDVPTVADYRAAMRATRRGATRTTAPKPPAYAHGDRVVITGPPAPPSMYGKHGTVTGSDPSSYSTERYLVEVDDGSKGWFSVTTSPWSVGDRVSVRAHGTNPHADAVGRITRFRPPLASGVRPVSIRLEADCPCPTCDGRRHAGTDLLVDETRLVHAPLPSLRPGDRVRIVGTSEMAGETGTVSTVEADSALPYRVDFDSTGYATTPHSWFRAVELEPLPAAPPPTTRTLLISLPLEPDAERPHSVTELIDLIAENWETVGWGFHDT